MLQREFVTHYVAMAELAETRLYGEKQAEWLNLVDAEWENFRSALQWAEEDGLIEAELKLATSLWGFGYRLGYLREGEQWLKRALDHAPSSNFQQLRVKAYMGLGGLAWSQGQFNRARDNFRQSLGLADNEADKASILNNLGLIEMHEGNFDQARKQFKRAYNILKRSDRQVATALALGNMGEASFYMNELPEARSYLTQSLRLHQQAKNDSGVALALMVRGDVGWREGNLSQAREDYLASLKITVAIKDREGIAECLRGIAMVDSQLSDDESILARSAQLLGAYEKIREDISSPIPQAFEPEYRQFVAQMRSRLGSDHFDSEWSLGRTRPLDEIIQILLPPED